MKIYILPYTLKTKLITSKLHSGIDKSMLMTIEALDSLGYDYRVPIIDGDDMDGFVLLKPGLENPKEFCKNRKNVKELRSLILDDIRAYQPNLILSMHELNSFYKDLNDLDIPIIYQLHEIPGSFTFLSNSNILHEMSKRHTLLCVSKFHKDKTESYFNREKKEWNFRGIDFDDFLPSAFISREPEVQESDGTIKHVSVASRDKKTFLIFDWFENENKKVFTTSNHLQSSSSTSKNKEYFDKYYGQYANDIVLDCDREELLKEYGKAMCAFVGLASYDTYTITSLEALSMGVPLILKGNSKYEHPAFEMCCDEMKKYVFIVNTKQEALEALEKIKKFTMDDRRYLSALCAEKNSMASFKNKLVSIANGAITKYNANAQNKLF